MLRLGAEAWVLINIPDFSPRRNPLICQIDAKNICILGGRKEESYASDGIILKARTGAVIRQINPSSKIRFYCVSQSFMKAKGQILSMVETSKRTVHLICYNQADNCITTIRNYSSK